MKRLILIGIAVIAVPTIGMLLVMASMGAWERLYWSAAPDLAKAFRTATSDEVLGKPVMQLVGLSVAAAQAQAEQSKFACLPRREALHCVRFVPNDACSDDWELILETADGRVSRATGTKTATCIEAKEVH